MSDTPRTDFLLSQDVDAVEFVNLARHLESECRSWEAKFNKKCDDDDASTFRAMKAERELAELRAKLGECWTRHDNLADENQKLREATIEECARVLDEIVAWMAAHKNPDGIVTGRDFHHPEIDYIEDAAKKIRALKDKP
jgi:DNA-binding transcriptional regulator PaaX